MFPGSVDPAIMQGMFAGMLADPGARAEIEKAIADWFRSKGWNQVLIYGTANDPPPMQDWGSPEVIAYQMCELAIKHLTA